MGTLCRPFLLDPPILLQRGIHIQTPMSTPSTSLEQLADQLLHIYEEEERRAILEARAKLHGWLSKVSGCDVQIGCLRDGSYCLRVQCRGSVLEIVRAMAPDEVGGFPVQIVNLGVEWALG